MNGDEPGREQSQPSGAQGEAAANPAGVDLAKVRELVLRANPDVVPEMIAGDSFDALMGSIEPAKAAYQRIVERVGTASAQPPAVPAGQPQRQPFVVNIEALSPSAKIAEGIKQRRKG